MPLMDQQLMLQMQNTSFRLRKQLALLEQVGDERECVTTVAMAEGSHPASPQAVVHAPWNCRCRKAPACRNPLHAFTWQAQQYLSAQLSLKNAFGGLKGEKGGGGGGGESAGTST
jgi:hypothetical protein